jgi:hypothetical protein
MGYELDELVAQIAAGRPTTQHLAGDLVRMPYDLAYRTFELDVAARRARDVIQRRRPLLAHK